jgi:hypothetical protein
VNFFQFLFDLTSGANTSGYTSNPHLTFGFINALVDSNGVPTQSSQGVVDFDTPATGVKELVVGALQMLGPCQ